MCKAVPRALGAHVTGNFVLRDPHSEGEIRLQKVGMRAEWRLPLGSTVDVHKDPVDRQFTHPEKSLAACHCNSAKASPHTLSWTLQKPQNSSLGYTRSAALM